MTRATALAATKIIAMTQTITIIWVTGQEAPRGSKRAQESPRGPKRPQEAPRSPKKL